MKAPLPPDEAQRLASLRSYNILDTPPDAAFDDLALLASHICQTPIAMVSLVDEHRQWFKSKIGISATETARDIAFCAHTILHKDEILEVRDAEADPRFADSTLVTTDPHIRFYAGAPLVTPDGHALGALCVLDRTPRQLTPEQLAALSALSRHVVTQLELRRKGVALQVEAAERQRAEEQLLQQNEQLTRSEQESIRLLALAEKSRGALLSVLEDEQLTGKNLRAAEAELRSTHERLQHLLDQSPAVNYSLKVEGDRVTPQLVSENMTRLLGFTLAEANSYEWWAEHLHPEDLKRAAASVPETLQRGKVTIEYRLRHKDGHYVWVEDSRRTVYDPSGRPTEIAGIWTDITDRKRAENRAMAFSNLGHRLSAAHTAKEAAQIIVEKADKLLGWDACFVELYLEEQKLVVPVLAMDTVEGKRMEIQMEYASKPPTQRTQKTIAEGAQLILREPAAEPPSDLVLFGDKGRVSASIMVAPVRDGHQVIGILSIQNYTPNAYDADDLQVLQALADHCAGALERIQAGETLKQRISELERFHRVSVGRELQMMDLKREINDLSQKLGQPPPYNVPAHPG